MCIKKTLVYVIFKYIHLPTKRYSVCPFSHVCITRLTSTGIASICFIKRF
jgi:hypothetical protein